MEEKYLIWHIQGGLGKHIAATSLLEDLKSKYKDYKLILTCAYPEVFLNIPFVDRVYNLNKLSYFYETYIKDKEVIIFKHDPYDSTGYITKTQHIIESWCDILKIKYQNQQPFLYINYSQNSLLSKWERSKPILLLQTTGGVGTNIYSWTRDLPIELSLEIVNKYSSSYHIIHVTKPEGYQIPNVERIDQELSFSELSSLVQYSSKRIFIDSSLQHIAASLSLPSNVIWIGTSPTVFGYSIHQNIISNPINPSNQLIDSYTSDYSFYDNYKECPYPNIESMFNIKDVLENLDTLNQNIILHQNL